MDTEAMNEPVQTLVAPRFRSPSRLVAWVRRNKVTSRLPPESEKCFFSGKVSSESLSNRLVEYGARVGDLGTELEGLLSGHCVVVYVRNLCRAGKVPSDFVLDRVRPEDLLYLSQYCGRLPERLERKMTGARALAEYASNVGPLQEHLEEIIISDGDALMKYIKVLIAHSRPVEERFLRAMVGRDSHYCALANMVGPLPQYLVESISDPQVALDYASRTLKGRLPDKVEAVLQNDHRCAVRYAFEVVRAYSSPQLPEAVHAAVLMKSFEDPNDREIRRYVDEVRRVSSLRNSDTEEVEA